MPYRIIFHAGAGELDHIDCQTTEQIKASLIELIERVADFSEDDQFAIIKMSEIDLKNEQFWNEFYNTLRK